MIYSARKTVKTWQVETVLHRFLCIRACKYGCVVEEGEGEESRAAAEAAAATAAAAESFWLMVGIGMDNSRGYSTQSLEPSKLGHKHIY